MQPAGNVWLQAATELAEEMQEMAADERAAELFVSDSGLLAYIRGIGTAGYDRLREATVVEIPRAELTAGFLSAAFASSAEPDTAELRRLTELMKSRINPAVVVSALNGQEGSDHLAACSILTGSRTYIQPQDWRDDLLVVLEYGSEYAVAIAFWQSGEKTVTGQASFIRAGRTEALLRSVEKFCGHAVPVRKLTGRELKKDPYDRFQTRAAAGPPARHSGGGTAAGDRGIRFSGHVLA